MKSLKDWTGFEITFLLMSVALGITLTLIFNGEIIYLIYTLLEFVAALLLAKGKYSSYVIGIISTLYYLYISYTNNYYGEIIISVFCTLPLMIGGLINWLKHQDQTNTVIVKKTNQTELIIVLISPIIMFAVYYYLLKYFNTSNLKISTYSIVSGLVSTYLIASRSEYGFVGFIINDLILIILWGLPVLSGDLSLIPVLLCPVLLFINDIYGLYNWRKIKVKQMINN